MFLAGNETQKLPKCSCNCFTSAYFRVVTEENGVDLNTKNYAYMKRNVCQARARNLRHHVQSNPTSDTRTASVRYTVYPHIILLIVLLFSLANFSVRNFL